MNNLWFKSLQLHKYNNYINVQQILVVAFEFTGAVHGFMILRGQKGWTAVH